MAVARFVTVDWCAYKLNGVLWNGIDSVSKEHADMNYKITFKTVAQVFVKRLAKTVTSYWYIGNHAFQLIPVWYNFIGWLFCSMLVVL